MTYDIQGRPLTATINPGASQSVYTMSYDAVGNLAQLSLPLGGYLQYTYDTSQRLTQVLNDRGHKVVLTPNAMGDPTAVETRNAASTAVKQHSYAYDELGRLLQSIDAGPKTTVFGYDKVDNLKSITDARSKLWQTAFDPLNRVITQTNPNLQAVQKTYDGQDRLVTQTDGRGKVTSRVVDGFGRTIREVSPERGTIDYWYDLNDNLTKLVDADSEETDFTYDNASRRLTAAFPAETTDNVTYAYDSVVSGNKGAGRLTSVQDASGTSAFTYDAQGRVTSDVKVIDGRTYTVGYVYDTNGKATQINLPSGRQVLVARANDGLVTGVTTKATSGATATTIVSGVAYAPFGPLQSLTYGNGLALTRTLDLNYRISRIQVTAAGANRLDVSFTRTNNGQLVDTIDNIASGRGGNNGYTNSGRLAYAQGPWGEWDYGYDAAGNLTERSKLVGGVKTFAYIVPWTSSNRIDHVETGAGVATRNFSYRLGGDLAQDQRVGGDTYDYYYNARKRVVVVKKNTVDAGWYNYDAFGRRVSRTVFGGATTTTTHYIFDGDGRLLAEHDNATGNVIKEYVWLGDNPVAVIDKSSGTATTYSIHTGPIDEPLIMTDGAKAKVWDAYMEPYGAATVFGTPTSNIDLRLPGQYLEAEAGGLHQNWMRDYDPTLGRYIQTDPLGIGAGQNVYSYVDGRPTEFLDITGLQLSRAIQAAMGLSPPLSTVSHNTEHKPANDNPTSNLSYFVKHGNDDMCFFNKELAPSRYGGRQAQYITQTGENRIYFQDSRYSAFPPILFTYQTQPMRPRK